MYSLIGKSLDTMSTYHFLKYILVISTRIQLWWYKYNKKQYITYIT